MSVTDEEQQQHALAVATEQMGQINRLLRKTAVDQTEIGTQLYKLHKSVLKHGWKARIYADSDNPLPGIEPLDITQADGEQLIRIAKNTALADSRNSEKLPWARSTLDVLSKVPAGILQGAIDRGEVTRKLKCAEAEDLVRRLKGESAEPAKKDPPPWDNDVEAEALRKRILAAVEPWIARCEPLDRVPFAEEALRKAADYLQQGRERCWLMGALAYRIKPFDTISIQKVVTELDLPESRAMQVIDRVREGRICGEPERMVLQMTARQAR